MSYNVGVAVANLIRILYRLNVISDTMSNHLIDEITVKVLEHDLLKREK